MTTESLSPEEQAIRELLDQEKKLDYGAERIGVVEEAVRLADAGGLEELAYDARLALMQAAVLGGYPEKGFVAFAWCASKSKAEPERFKESKALLGMFLTGVDVLWSYKWMTLQVPWYPQVTREQVDETLRDMEQRYAAHGLSLRPVHMARVRLTIEMGGDLEEATEHYRRWQYAPRDLYADCDACEVSFQAYFQQQKGDHERALLDARPLLDGEKSCAEVPHNTYARLLQSALELGRKDEARRFHEVGYPMVRDNRDFVWNVSRHIHYLTRVGDLERAQHLAERHLDWAVGNRVLDRTMWYFAALRDLFGALASKSQTVKARLSPKLSAHDPSGEYDPARLQEFFANETAAIADRFDLRNGNDYVSCRVSRSM